MIVPQWTQLARVGLLCSALVAPLASAAERLPPASATLASIDLAGPFGTRSPWRFGATQAPPIDDPFGSAGDQLPGAVTLCLQKGASGPCDPQLQTGLADTSDNTLFAERHYLEAVRIVHPGGRSARPLLLVVTASLHSGDGDQAVLTQALSYSRETDRFVRVYEHSTGKNNNQEVRYVDDGPLAGSIISVEPTEDAPFGFWVTVNALAGGQGYRQVLRYRSATTYEDGNPLPVIDSEMPNIQRRLGLWRPGLPPPLPATSCPKPHLIRMELWCS